MDFSIDFLGLHFKNPIWLAASPATSDSNHVKRGIEAGWGGAVLKTITLDKYVKEHDVRPRLAACKRDRSLITMQNIEGITTKPLSWWKDEFDSIKQAGIPLIVSIMALPSVEELAELAIFAEENRADLLELNVSCPHGAPEKFMGTYIGQNPNLVESVTKVVTNTVSIPVMVKLTAQATNIVEIADAVKRGGAKAVSVANTFLGLCDIDIFKAKPQPDVFGYSSFGGQSGPGIKPINLRCVAQIAQHNVLPISGTGGISTWQDVIEYIMVGASTVQVATAVMWNGYGIIKEWLERIEEFAERQGYSSFDDIKGRALKSLVNMNELVVKEEVRAQIDLNSCDSCRKCVTACKDGASGAIIEPTTGEINKEKCVGCGLCALVCPQHAITMIEK